MHEKSSTQTEMVEKRWYRLNDIRYACEKRNVAHLDLRMHLRLRILRCQDQVRIRIPRKLT